MKRGEYEKALKDADKAGKTEDVSVRFISLRSPGETIVGTLTGVQRVPGQKEGKGYYQYVLDTDKGFAKVSFGNAYDNEMSNILHLGGVYAFTYVGQHALNNGHRVNEVKTVIIDMSEAGETVANFVARTCPAG